MTDNFGDEFMIVEPIILEIFLNKNNYKDRILISELKKKAQMIKVPEEDSSFFVKTEEVEDILYNKYKKEIQNLDSTSPKNLANTHSSVYFIETAMRTFANLKYFRIHVSEVEDSNSKEAAFDYKVMHSKIDLANNLEEDFLEYCLDLFSQIGVYNPSYKDPRPYLEISVRDLYYRMYKHASQFEEDSQEYVDVHSLIDLLGKKIEADDSSALIILKK
jgi:hypothetical protein